MLTLSGKIVAPLPAAADVTAIVGAKPYIVKADGDGNFTVTIESADASALVRLQTKLVGSLSFVELLGNLGAFSELMNAAGDDGTLTADENIRTNVTSLSTAEAVLLDEAQGAGSRKILELAAGIDPDQTLALAAVIELVMTEPEAFALPEGTATTLELARDATRRNAFTDDIQKTAPEKLEQTKQNLVSNTNVVGSDTEPGTPPELLAVLAGRQNGYPFLTLSVVDGFEFAGDGSGLYFNADARENIGMQWVRQENKVIVMPDPGVSTYTYAAYCEGDGSFREATATYRYDRFQIVRLSPIAVSVTKTVTTTRQECGETEVVTNTFTEGRLSAGAEASLPLSASELTASSYALPVLTAEPLINTDRLKFNADGTGRGGFLAGNFTWSLAGNVLTIAYGGGVVGTYRVVREIDGVARGFVADFSGPSGRSADMQIGFAGSSDAGFVESEIPARYFQFGIGVEPFEGGIEQNPDPRLEGFRLRFDTNRTGVQENDAIGSDGNPVLIENEYFFTWTLQSGGNLVVRRYYDEDNETDIGCNPAQSNACVLFDTRVIVPVNRVGERYYWIERRRFDENTTVPYSSDARFYDRVPLDSGKHAASRQRSTGKSGDRTDHGKQRLQR